MPGEYTKSSTHKTPGNRKTHADSTVADRDEEARPRRHPALERLCENPCVRGSQLVCRAGAQPCLRH